MSKIALVQFKASTEKKKNLPKILGYIKQAAKNNADMVTFPEYMMFYTPSTQTAKQVAQEAETINGEFVSAVAQSAKENSIIIVEFSSPRESEKLKKKAIKKVFRSHGHRIRKPCSKGCLPSIFDSLCHCFGIFSKVGKTTLIQKGQVSRACIAITTKISGKKSIKCL